MDTEDYSTMDTDSELETTIDENIFSEELDWTWEATADEHKYVLTKDDRLVTFGPQGSLATKGVKGNVPLAKANHHYWEIQLPADFDWYYETQTGIGIVTREANLNARSERATVTERYGFLLGIDGFSWGLSLTTGRVHHKGKPSIYHNEKFLPGDRIGVHLDRWNGTINFYCNNTLIGPAFKNDPETKKKLQTCELYPAAYSSANNMEMELTFAKSYESSLQFQSLQAICQLFIVSESTPLSECVRRCRLNLPPRIATDIRSKYWWLSVAPDQRAIKIYREKAIRSFPFVISKPAMNDSSRYTV